MSFPSYSINRDRKVKVLANGTPVSASTAASVYAKYLNFLGSNFSIAENNTLGTFDVSLTGLASPNKLIPKLNNTQVASTARNINFDNTQFNIAENVGNDNYDFSLKYPGRVFTNANTTTPRKLNFSTNLTAVENVGTDSVDVTAASGLSPVSNAIWGLFSGGGGSNSGTNNRGSGFMNGWSAINTMTSSVDTTDGSYLNFTTTSTSASFVEYSSATASSTFIRKFNPNFTAKIKIPVTTSNRMYIGFSDGLPLPANAFNFLNGNNGFGVRYDTAQDTTWKVMYNNGIATNPAPVDSAVTVSPNTLYTINIFADEANSRWGASINGSGPTYVTTGTGAPGQTTPVGFSIKYTTQTSAIRNMNMYYLFGVSDK